MDEDVLQRSLRARPPLDLAYRPRLTARPSIVARHGARRSSRPVLLFAMILAGLLLATAAVLIGGQLLRPSPVLVPTRVPSTDAPPSQATAAVGRIVIATDVSEPDAQGSYTRFSWINPDGSGLTVLPNPGTDSLVFSPDRTMVAFTSQRTWHMDQVYVMNIDGSGLRQLTTDRTRVADFEAWSADGRRIVYHRDGGEVRVVDTDGSNDLLLLTDPHATGVSWSPDGTRIAFASSRDSADPNALDATTELYVMDPDGSHLTRLTVDGGHVGYPQWSPDGTRIAYMTDAGVQQAQAGEFAPLREIHVIDADGTGNALLTSEGAHLGALTWSPGAERLAFAGDLGDVSPDVGLYAIYTLDGKGGRPQRLTYDAVENGSPIWSPDGTRIVFTKARNNISNSDVYVMSADGSDVTELTNTPEGDGPIAWLAGDPLPARRLQSIASASP